MGWGTRCNGRASRWMDVSMSSNHASTRESPYAPVHGSRVQHHQVRGAAATVVRVQEQVAIVLLPRGGLRAGHEDGFRGEAPLRERGRVRLEAAARGQVDLGVWDWV
jgi:hypothetical protein